MLQLIVNKTYSCQFCGNKYTQEKTLAVHICEQKRRYLAKDEKHVNIGYIAFNKFFQLTQIVLLITLIRYIQKSLLIMLFAVV